MALRLRPGKLAPLKAVALALLVPVLVVVIAVAWFVRSPLPKLDGTLRVPGITARVQIRRDERGIAHITAAHESDLLFGEGFACAQDRLWQMDLLRRTAEGKLSQVVGPAGLDVDRYMRTIGLGRAAARDATLLKGQARLDVEAYSEGVNAAAATRPLPIEFRLLGYRPALWTPTDSIAIVKLMAQRLDDQWDHVELKALIQGKIGAAAASALMDAQVPHFEHFIVRGHAAPAQNISRDSRWLTALAGSGFSNPFPAPADNGSNDWVVSGRLVTTGKPVLSNDTHLEHSVPSTYWLAQLKGDGMDVEGFIIPGIPFIALGHNERIAFGVTSGDMAVQDLYVEKFRFGTSDQYLFDGRWLRAAHRIERIAVKGAPSQSIDVLETRHGPLVKRNGITGFALAWTILRSGAEINLLRSLDRASDWTAFQSALAPVVGPVFNWAYADIEGNVGYHLAGKIPQRLQGNGSLPVEGQDTRFDWHGYVPFNQLPHALNPSGGFLATANNQLALPGTPFGSSPFFDSPYRVDRIYRSLGSHKVMSPMQIGAVQLDTIDQARLALAKITADNLKSSRDARLRRIGTDLAAWDGNVTIASAAPSFLVAEQQALIDELLTPKLGGMLVARYEKFYESIVPFERVWRGDRSLRTIGITRETLWAALPGAAAKAADEVHATAARGLDVAQPWGSQNVAKFDHPLGRQWPLDVLFNIHGFEQPGDGLTVYAAKPNHGPASRLVVDLSDWDNSSMLLTLGESGQFNSPYYQDEVNDFRAARWSPTPFSDAAVGASTKDTLVLAPKE